MSREPEVAQKETLPIMPPASRFEVPTQNEVNWVTPPHRIFWSWMELVSIKEIHGQLMVSPCIPGLKRMWEQI